MSRLNEVERKHAHLRELLERRGVNSLGYGARATCTGSTAGVEAAIDVTSETAPYSAL